jgi:hypothetical protein
VRACVCVCVDMSPTGGFTREGARGTFSSSAGDDDVQGMKSQRNTTTTTTTTTTMLNPRKTSREYIAEEFRRVLKKNSNKHHLTLQHVLSFQTTGFSLPVDISHLGVLWILDRNHDGKITLDELYGLLDFCREEGMKFPTYELENNLRALCTIKLWEDVGAGPEGKEAFVHWISNLLIENSSERRRFWRYGSHQYIHVFTLEILHKVLKLQEVLGIGFQAFIDVLQRVAEEQKMMDLCDEEQDDWVPLNVVREFMSSTYLGAVKLMADISNPIDRE